MAPRRTPPGWDEGRSLNERWRWAACYAPATTLYLDQFGHARACCQNTQHRLGDIATSTLREIWDGREARALRRAMGRGDLSLGCDFCAWQADEGGPGSDFARTYDDQPTGMRRAPAWPTRIEFAVSNTCNLRCVMCNGDWSSAIRSRREHRPPLPSAYPERFYEELVEFIPHLEDASFAGGEPFLGSEPLRIMELLAEHGEPGLVLGIVTNATTIGPRVERILERTTPGIVVSVDGGTAEVYERIRVGARFDQMVRNLDRLHAIVLDHGTRFTIAHCLMVDNWETFPELLRFAEERGVDVSINTVRFPERHSLYHLPASALVEVVASLRNQTPLVERTVSGSRLITWHEQLDALAQRSTSRNWPDALGVAPAPAGAVAVAAPQRRTTVVAGPDHP